MFFAPNTSDPDPQEANAGFLAYRGAGVEVHFLEPDPALPYQVFARDSSINVSDGPIVTQPAQWWRRGEYAAVIRFYQEAGIPIWQMATAGAIEGGDVMIVEPGSMEEAFLDVSGLERISGSPVQIAIALRREVRERVGLPITVGVATPKSLAKIASAPAGLCPR